MPRKQCLIGLVFLSIFSCSPAFPQMLGVNRMNTHPGFKGGSTFHNKLDYQNYRKTYISRGGTKESSSTSTVPSYYLLWSPGMKRRIAASFFFFLLINFAYPPSQIIFQQSYSVSCSHSRSSGVWATFFHSVLLPMLSSACCSIQLLINALIGAGGCAGFNAYLGPLRPFFIGFLLFSTVFSLPLNTSNITLIGRWAAYTSIVWTVGILPEIVHVWNVQRKTRWKQRHITSSEGRIKARVEIEIPAMACVACINKIDNSLRQCNPQQIEEATSWLEASETRKGGRASIKVSASTEDEIHVLVEALVDAVRGAGFDTCTIQSVDII